MTKLRQIASHEDLVACFRRIDRKDVELADDLSMPLKINRVLTWSYGNRAFIIFRDGNTEDLKGIVFHRPSTGPQVPSMCCWCQRVRNRGEVKLLGARLDSRRTIGQYLCADLSCFRVDADRTPGIDDLQESPDAVLNRAERAFARMLDLVSLRLLSS
jgi:hypothetical protein